MPSRYHILIKFSNPKLMKEKQDKEITQKSQI